MKPTSAQMKLRETELDISIVLLLCPNDRGILYMVDLEIAIKAGVWTADSSFP